MEEYYLIPITENSVLLNEETLLEYTKKAFPNIYKREDERISILYSTSPLIEMPESEKRRYHMHNEETEKILKEMQLPSHLIARGTNKEVIEIITGKKLIPEYSSALGIRKVSKEKAESFFYETNYKTYVINFFKSLNESLNINEEPFAETYFCDFYLNGTLNGNSIQGDFKGTIKIRKLVKKV